MHSICLEITLKLPNNGIQDNPVQNLIYYWYNQELVIISLPRTCLLQIINYNILFLRYPFAANLSFSQDSAIHQISHLSRLLQKCHGFSQECQ